jgi:hypothetical protein
MIRNNKMKKIIRLFINNLNFDDDSNVETKKRKRTKKERNDETDDGRHVYHVAHPEIKGIVCQKLNENVVEVWFENPIDFSGNPMAGKRQLWGCSRNLLFPTPEEARRNHDPSKA